MTVIELELERNKEIDRIKRSIKKAKRRLAKNAGPKEENKTDGQHQGTGKTSQ